MKGRWVVIAVLLAGISGVPMRSVLAQTSGGDAEIQRLDRDKLFEYAGCAASIAVAGSSGQWWVAAFGCAKVFNEYWTK